jgi:hypothetical protein
MASPPSAARSNHAGPAPQAKLRRTETGPLKTLASDGNAPEGAAVQRGRRLVLEVTYGITAPLRNGAPNGAKL